MNKIVPLKIAALAAMCSLATASGAVVTLVNADFETATGKVTTGYSTITGWYNAGATYTDSGVESTTGKTLVSGTPLGAYAAYVYGSEPGAYQIGSGYTVNTGDTITLTWEAAPTSNSATGLASANLVSLFAVNAAATASQGVAPTSLSGYSLLSTNTAALSGTNNQFQTYTLTYVATGADQGKAVGVRFGGTTAVYSGFDNFSIAVTAVPEPTAYGLLGAGALGAVALVRRRRRSV